MATVHLSNPFEALYYGLQNYYATNLGSFSSRVSFTVSNDLAEMVANSKMEKFIIFLEHNGMLYGIGADTEVGVFESKDKLLQRVIPLAKKIVRAKNKTIDVSELLKTAPFTDMTAKDVCLVALGVCINVLTQIQYKSPFTVYFETKILEDMNLLMSYSIYSYYLTKLGYLNFSFQTDGVNLNEVNNNVFAEISRVKGYLSTDLISSYDKQKYMEDLNLVEGSVVFLYTRGGYSPMKFGKLVKSCKVAIIDKISDKGVYLKTITVSKTVADLFMEYEDLPHKVKQLYPTFSDFIKFNDKMSEVMLTWDVLGINYMMNNNNSGFMEQFFITRLESLYDAQLGYFTEEGSYRFLLLGIPDATIYLLLEYGIEFNEDLFVEQYNSKNMEKLKELAKDSVQSVINRLGYDFRGI